MTAQSDDHTQVSRDHNPPRPVAESGWQKIETAAKSWQMLEELRAPEGAAVTFVCDNPDFGPGPPVYIEVCDDWTGWKQRSFPGETVRDCLDAALKARAAVPLPAPPHIAEEQTEAK